MKLHSVGISGLLTMDLHSLNNEGSEGNALMTRMVEVVDEKGNHASVNAVSGDMFKHIQAEHLFQLAKEDGLPLCAGCKVFSANRINQDEEFPSRFKKDAADGDIAAEVIKTCVIDDVEGILITREIGGKSRSIGRKSAIEFGWVVGRPQATRTESYFHAKYVPEGRGKGSGSETGENLGQNIFHRPASSGQYAAVVNVDLYRIGRNDITLEYVLKPQDRLVRSRALLRSLMHTFLKPSGAHRNTQNPHIVNFEGVICASSNTMPAPLVSALSSKWREEIEGVAQALCRGQKEPSVRVFPFEGLKDFSEKMADVIEKFQVYGG